MNVIHTANPVEHVNSAMIQPNFINPMHHASVDLSGHNLVNAHQASGTATQEQGLGFKILKNMLLHLFYMIKAQQY